MTRTWAAVTGRQYSAVRNTSLAWDRTRLHMVQLVKPFGSPMEQIMAKKKFDQKSLHVLPTAKGEWAVKSAGAPKPLKTLPTKAAATKYAKALVEKKTMVAEKRTGKKSPSADIITHHKGAVSVYTTKQGKVSKVGPAKAKKGSPQFGSAEGMFVIADDFEETPEGFDEYVE